MKARILVVDDDKDVVRLMRAYLEQSDFEVLVAYNGETAMHILRRDRPDLVLLDIMLPDHDGWEITRWLRRDPLLQNTPCDYAHRPGQRYRQDRGVGAWRR